MTLLSAGLGFVVSMWLTWRFCEPASRFHILDHPNDRSLHTQPTPRSGGLAILAGTVLGLVLTAWRIDQIESLYWLLLSVLLIAVVSYMDDRRNVPVVVRLSMHVIVACLLVWAGFSLRITDLPRIGFTGLATLNGLLTLICVTSMINLYNFMDGMDGLAAGMAVSGFGTLAVLGWMGGHEALFAIGLIIAAASAGFLFFNFPPARIFMGDTGSSTLGLLAAALSLWGVRDGVFPFWIAGLVFSPFIADATVTLMRRLLRGEKVWQAHKTHYYQRLVLAGWGHRKTLYLEYTLMLGCSLTAVWAVRASAVGQSIAIVIWGVVYACLFLWISLHVDRNR